MARVEAWEVAALFASQEQAKQAAEMMKALAPAAYKLTAWDSRHRPVWQEEGNDYGASDVRV